MVIPLEFEEFITGGLVGAVSDILIDVPLSRMGAFYTVTIVEQGGAWIWGFGTGDAINIIAGLLIWMGVIPQIPSEFGLGYLFAVIIAKLSELYTPVARYTKTKANKNYPIIV